MCFPIQPKWTWINGESWPEMEQLYQAVTYFWSVFGVRAPDFRRKSRQCLMHGCDYQQGNKSQCRQLMIISICTVQAVGCVTNPSSIYDQKVRKVSSDSTPKTPGQWGSAVRAHRVPSAKGELSQCCAVLPNFPFPTPQQVPLLYWVFPKEKSCSLKNQNLCNWGQPFHVSVSKHFRICRTLCKEYKHGFGRLAQTFLKARWLGWFLIQHLKLFFCWRWENSVLRKTIFCGLCYDIVSAFIHLKTQKNPRERKFAFLLWSQLKSWTLVQVNSSLCWS